MISFTDVPFTIELYADEGFAQPDLTGAHDIHVTFKAGTKKLDISGQEAIEVVGTTFLKLWLNQQQSGFFHGDGEVLVGANWLDSEDHRHYAGDGVIEVANNLLNEVIGGVNDAG